MVDEVLVLPIYQGKPRRWIALVEKDILDYQTLQKRAEVLFDLYSKRVRTFSFEADPLQTYGKAGIGDLVEVISKRLGLKATARVITIEISESSRGLSTRYEVGSPEWKLEEFIKSLSPRVFQRYDVGQVVGVYHGTTVDPVKDSPAVTYFALPSELLETVMLYMDVEVQPYVSRYQAGYPQSVVAEHTHSVTVTKTDAIQYPVYYMSGRLYVYWYGDYDLQTSTTNGHYHLLHVYKGNYPSPAEEDILRIDESSKTFGSVGADADRYVETSETDGHTHLFKIHKWISGGVKIGDTFRAVISADTPVDSLSSDVTYHVHPVKPTTSLIASEKPLNVKVDILTPEGSTYTIDLGSGESSKKGINVASIFKSAGLYKMTWKTDTMATINFIIYGQILIRSVVY